MLRNASLRIGAATAALTLAALGVTATTASAATPTATGTSTAASAPALVEVTVVDGSRTLYKGYVLTAGHTVTTASGGTHVCDGTNGGANPSPVPTPTAALDTAMHWARSSWDGTWSASFDDYLVTTIAGDASGASTYWNIAVDGASIPVGGCQFALKTGDSVVFAMTSF
jgi:hypothetical protein